MSQPMIKKEICYAEGGSCFCSCFKGGLSVDSTAEIKQTVKCLSPLSKDVICRTAEHFKYFLARFFSLQNVDKIYNENKSQIYNLKFGQKIK